MRRNHGGFALIAVLWLIAILSLLVMGLLSSVRGEIRVAQRVKDAVALTAEADAAILLALQAIHADTLSQGWERGQVWTQPFQGRNHNVELLPASAWVDLNRAPEALLQQLFQHGAGVSADQAVSLAGAVVAFRAGDDLAKVNRFESVSDLLALPGMPLDVYARIAGLVTVYGSSAAAGKVNPMAAPEAVLNVLAEGNSQRVAAWIAARSASSPTMDTTAFNPQHTQVAPENRVLLTVSAGRHQRRWWVQLRASGGPLPWRVLARETVVLPQAL